MNKTIGEIKRKYEIFQRILFIIMLVLGISTLVFGIISLFFDRLESVLSWSGFLGLGLGIFGGVGTSLTSQSRLQDLNRKQENDSSVRPEYRQRSKKPINNYIATPSQGIVVVSLFLASAILILLGSLNLLYWINRL